MENKLNRSFLRVAAGFVGIYLLGVPCIGSAAPHSEAKVRKAVETWVRRVTADKRADATIDRVEPYPASGQPVAYVVHLKNGGYCLAGADSLLLPVYWYSPGGTYNPRSPGCRAILQEIEDRLSYVKTLQAKGDPSLQKHKTALDERASQWDALAAGQTTTSSSSPASTPAAAGSSLVLPLTWEWSQEDPYNLFCPWVPNMPPTRSHVVVGCVATAMAQVMNYWQWPNTGAGSGTGTYSYRWTSGALYASAPNDPMISTWEAANDNIGYWDGILSWANGILTMSGSWDDSLLSEAKTISSDSKFQTALQTLYNYLSPAQANYSANFGATTYNWSQTQNTFLSDQDPGALDAATISFHAGVAVQMSYGLDGSGIPQDAGGRIPSALSGNFHYDASATYGSLDVNRMVDEIQWQRPVILCGQNSSAGHCWVVYGYNQGTSPWQFMMNMGWGGMSDGWYSVDSVPFGLTQSQGHTTRIAPYRTVAFVGSTGSGNGSPASPYYNIQQAITNAATGATLMFKAGSYNTFTTPQLTMNRPLTLKGINSVIGK